MRLAHVHILMGDDATADAILTPIVSRPLPPATKYVALLMLGGIPAQRQQQVDTAARGYVDAVLAVPDGQSAYLALAQVMHRAGQAAEAATVLERLFGRAILTPDADPWWIYPLGMDLNFDARLAEYRADVRRYARFGRHSGDRHVIGGLDVRAANAPRSRFRGRARHTRRPCGGGSCCRRFPPAIPASRRTWSSSRSTVPAQRCAGARHERQLARPGARAGEGGGARGVHGARPRRPGRSGGRSLRP